MTVDPAGATRLMSWNTLNFPGPSGPSREDDFRAVIGAVQPDILACMELQDLAGAQEFYNGVLDVVNPGEWTLASFTSSYDTERGLFYRSSQFSEIAHGQLPTDLRTIEWWEMRPVGYTSSAADLYVFVVHLKASTGSDNEAKRLAEVQVLRDHLETLPAGANFVIAGDYNIYDSGEPAWAELTGSQANNDGRSFDPINRVGDWHNNASYADIHTQSTRTVYLGDGGATGGMDDRFDFILANDDLLDDEALDLRVNTYLAYGQDGAHFNLNVNDPPTNSAVGQALADHLQAASDHLPVVVDLQLPAVLSLSGTLDFGDVLVGSPVQGSFSVGNPAAATSDELDVSVASTANFTPLPSSFQVAPGASSDVTVYVNTGSEGDFSQSVSVSSDAVDQPVQSILATVRVVGASTPSFDATLPVTATDFDFGEHDVGSFGGGEVSVFDVASGSLPADLQIYDAQITGPDAARFSVPGFTASTVAAAPESVSFALVFDDAGASQGATYEATLIFSTRDAPDVTGGQDRADLTVALSATVAVSGTPAPEVPVLVTRLLPNVPNPFNPRTQLRYELAEDADARLEIFDLRGRRVRTLVDQVQSAGLHSVLWQGRDDRGGAVASGSYIVRLSASGHIFSQRIGLIR
jgi:endonuclease/exonuclease/phosphatase family metal-dependent hydrolase